MLQKKYFNTPMTVVKLLASKFVKFYFRKSTKSLETHFLKWFLLTELD